MSRSPRIPRRRPRNIDALRSVLRRPGILRAALKRARVPRRLTSGLSGSLRTRGFLLWGATLVTGILCVSQHVYSTDLAKQIEGLRDTRKSVEAEIGFLRVESAKLSGRERIEAYAVDRLGMRYPEAHEVVRLGDGAVNSWNRWGDDLVEGSTFAVNDG